MNKAAIAALLAVCSVTGPADARKKPVATWTASRITDPITAQVSCTVIAKDRLARMRLTRTGALYPIVELNSDFGLLVGVGSGGQYRLPTGDIVWRVDANPFHTIRAEDNPVAVASPATTANVADQALQTTMAHTNRIVAAMTATSTLASGAKARAMLAEMLAGQALIFRSASVPTFGLPDARAQEVGQITRDGLKPIPLDESFRSSLAECGISAPT